MNDRVKVFGFNDNFIEQLAELILAEIAPDRTDLSRVGVVFGGRRPQLFLRKSLARRLGKAFFPPACFSMDEFVGRIVSRRQPLGQADELQNCFRLYRLAKEKLPGLLENRGSFSEFLAWAREILGFIEQLDLQDVPDGKLREIERSASIGYEVPESVNALLKQISLLRAGFHAELEKNGTLTRGMAYRLAAGLSAEEGFPEFETLIFCNFYYLHAAELAILRGYYSRGKATLVFQRDTADWPVLEQLEREFGITIPGVKSAAAPSISIYSAFDTQAQVSCCRKILSQVKVDQSSVIVLPEPDTLIPLLSEIAGSAPELNVSLGYPVKRSQLYSLFSLIFQAQTSRNAHGYYSRDYLNALSHPLVKNLCLLPGAGPSASRVLVHKIEEMLTADGDSEVAGTLFISPERLAGIKELFLSVGRTLKSMGQGVEAETLRGLFSRLHALLFTAWETIGDFAGFCACAEQLVSAVIDKSPVETYPLNLLVCGKILELTAAMRRGGFEREAFAPEEIFRVFLNELENRSLSFTGSPLKGLQVLGLLETRSLNFDHVIVLDLNERTLPRLSIYEPLIPREIMISLGLNRFEKEDEIQRYQFFRLIGGAKQAHLVYLSGEEKEKSRFLEELIWDAQKKTKTRDTPARETAFALRIQPGKKAALKTPETVAFLRKKRYSASSLNTYLQCPMRFYFRYVLGLEEKTDLLDETEPRDVGNFVHGLLEEAFAPLLGRKPLIDKRFRERFFVLFEEHFSRTFEQKMRSDAFLLKELLALRLQNFLEQEARRPVRQIVCLEQDKTGTIALEGGTFEFEYRIDRVDRMEDGSLLVLDYKTGGTEIKPAPPADILARGLDREALNKNLKSFQMPLYHYFTCRRRPQPAVNAGLYNLRNGAITYLLKTGDPELCKQACAAFLSCLQAVLGELLDPSIPFVPDQTNPQYCSFCPFSRACR